jgi:lipopolysaccharide/colanic/teichoic acid biosynthesis glycosyltransferase
MATQRSSTLSERGISAKVLDRELDGAPFVLDANKVMRRLREDRYGLDVRPVYDTTKRVFDIAVAVAAIAGALPLLLLIALAIKLDSRGPVFFCQERLGKGTKPFRMIKFRSMHQNAGSLPPELMQANEATGPLFKMRRDPRITRVGRILRRTSLDELPQVFNVLLGSMSIVGPRPPLPREMAGFESIQRGRLQVKPGLAGLWQVSGRSNLTFDEMVKLDLEYIRNRGFFYDVSLILRTVPAVLFGRGAW